MQDVGEPVGGAEAMLVQFLPLTILSLIYAVVVFVIARKRRINPWGWTIGTLVPVFGPIFVGPTFMLLSFLSVFDRLNRLEEAGQF
jgi:hypothetical protein